MPVLIPFSLHHALTLMPLLWQSRIRCCHSCMETFVLISVIAVVMLDMVKLLFVVFNLLWLSFLNGVNVFNLLGQSVLNTAIWSLVYHFCDYPWQTAVILRLHLIKALAIWTSKGLIYAPAREIFVDLTLPPLWSLRGQHPAHEQRCFAEGNTDI